MAENNPKNYVDSLKNLLPKFNSDPKSVIFIISSLLTRVNSLSNVLNERTQEIVDLRDNVFDREKLFDVEQRLLSFSNFELNP